MDILLSFEIQAAIWNALRQHADALEGKNESTNVWVRPMFYESDISDDDYIEHQLNARQPATVGVKAVIMRYERSGNHFTAAGDELKYDVTLEIEDTFVGPQVSAIVERLSTEPTAQEVK